MILDIGLENEKCKEYAGISDVQCKNAFSPTANVKTLAPLILLLPVKIEIFGNQIVGYIN